MTPTELVACANRVCEEANRLEDITALHAVDAGTSTEYLHVVLLHKKTRVTRSLKVRVSSL